MSNNVSGSGAKITIIAVPTFPQGFVIDQFPADTDPLQIEEVETSNSEMGVNGDKITWQKAGQINVSLSVIPNTEGDKNLSILVATNRLVRNKVAVLDDITMVVDYVDGTTKTFTGGTIKSGKVANSISSDSKLKTPTYTFEFANSI